MTNELARLYLDVRHRTEALTEPLTDEDCQLQSMTDASPVKWHLAHTAWFFETFVLAPHSPGFRPYDPRWGFLFNSYYESVGPRHARPARGVLSRPSRRDIMAYRKTIDEQLVEFLPSASPQALELVTLGLAHEEQHQELILTDIQHAFSLNGLEPVYRDQPKVVSTPPTPLAWKAHPGGLVSIGHAGGGFTFDNEGPAHKVHLRPFDIASRLTTNAEYIAFIEDKGYERPELWLSDGLDAVKRDDLSAPLYWRRRDGVWLRYSLHGLITLDPNAPVAHVSYYEADAFARWSRARLPTEAEWEIAATASERDEPQLVDSGTLVPLARRTFLGSAWVWTQSAYSAYPGFVAAPGAVGEYNGKFMCNQIVLRGGSCFTPPGHVRPTYRNFFYPNARWQVSGIRLARDHVESQER